MIERDLFGRTVLVRHWGRVGGRGRERLDEYASEVEAAEAIGKIAAPNAGGGTRISHCGQATRPKLGHAQSQWSGYLWSNMTTSLDPVAWYDAHAGAQATAYEAVDPER